MDHYLVTGVSTGIGRAAAEALAARGAHVFGSVRRAEDAAAFESALVERGTALTFDVTDTDGIAAARDAIAARVGEAGLRGLVNNAGVAVPGPLMHLPVADLRQQMEINTVAQVAVTQAMLPMLGAHTPARARPGRIVMISSIAGKRTMPFLGAYAASKHALEAVSDALRRELMIYGIDVVVVEPGPIRTEIWTKAEALDTEPYRETDYHEMLMKVQDFAVKGGRSGMPAEKVGTLIADALTAKKPRTRYVITPNKFVTWTLPSLLSDRALDKVFARRLGMRRR